MRYLLNTSLFLLQLQLDLVLGNSQRPTQSLLLTNIGGKPASWARSNLPISPITAASDVTLAPTDVSVDYVIDICGSCAPDLLVVNAAASAVWVSTSACGAASRQLHTWDRHVLTREFWAEGSNVGDFNRDGYTDVVVGPYWYAGPTLETRTALYPPLKTIEVS